MLLFLLIFIGLPLLGWWVGVSIFDYLTGHKKETPNTYITHIHHYHDNRSITIQQQEHHPLK